MDIITFLEQFRDHLMEEKRKQEERWKLFEKLQDEFEYLKKHKGRDLYSRKELGEIYGRSDSTVWRRLRDYEIPCRGMLGKTYLYSLKEFEASMYITPQEIISERLRA